MVFAVACVSAAAPAAKAKGRTFYEDTRWGQSSTELIDRYGALQTDRVLEGVPVTVRLHLRGGSGLDFIEVIGRERHRGEDACDAPLVRLQRWVSSSAGAPTETGPDSVTWSTKTSNIHLFCDLGELGLVYEPVR